MSNPKPVATRLLLVLCAFVQCQANVVFQFTLDFHVKDPNNSSEILNKTIKVEHNQLSLLDNEPSASATSLPTDQQQYDEVAVQHLAATRRAVQQLNAELAPLVGRSDNLAARLKQTLRYANDVDASLESGNFEQHVELLRRYQTLVTNLRTPSPAGGVRTLEFVLLKLALEKYQLLARQQEIADYLQRADAAWTRFKNTQIVVAES